MSEKLTKPRKKKKEPKHNTKVKQSPQKFFMDISKQP